jgi:putative thioredoxin
VLDRLEGRSGGTWELAKVNTEKLQDVARAYNIRSIPDIKLFHRGNVIAEFSGAAPEYVIVQWLKEHLPGAHADQIEKARSLAAGSRDAEASGILEEILKQEPGNPEARTLLARILLFKDPVRALSLVAGIEEPKHAEAVGTVTSLGRLLTFTSEAGDSPPTPTSIEYMRGIGHVKRKEFEQALEVFIGIIRTDRYFDDDGSRKACIAIFKYLGEDHAVTVQYRRDFSSALY